MTKRIPVGKWKERIVTEAEHPNTFRLLHARTIWKEGNGDLVGEAADGEICTVGSVYDLDATERYLAEHGPEEW